MWMQEIGLKRIAQTLSTPDADGFHQAYDPYAQKRHDLLNALKEFARVQFQ